MNEIGMNAQVSPTLLSSRTPERCTVIDGFAEFMKRSLRCLPSWWFWFFELTYLPSKQQRMAVHDVTAQHACRGREHGRHSLEATA